MAQLFIRLASVAALGFAGPAFAQWTIEDVGPGIAHAANARGVVVGEQTSPQRAFAAFQGEVFVPPLPPGAIGSAAFAMNARGQAVGWLNFEDHSEAVLFTGAATTILPRAPHETADGIAQANGINDRGVIVGLMQHGQPVRGGVLAYAFRYVDGATHDLGTFPGGNYSDATAVNASGVVVGFAGHATRNAYVGMTAFEMAGDDMVDLGKPEGTLYSIATALNASGQVVGYAQTAAGDYRAFVFADGAMTVLGDLPGATSTVATGISDAGDIVGYSGPDGFLYRDGAFVDLVTLPETQAAGWTQLYPQAIGPQGVIAGYGVRAGELRAFRMFEAGRR